MTLTIFEVAAFAVFMYSFAARIVAITSTTRPIVSLLTVMVVVFGFNSSNSPINCIKSTGTVCGSSLGHICALKP